MRCKLPLPLLAGLGVLSSVPAGAVNAAKPAGWSAKKVVRPEILDLNKASEKELAVLPGVGVLRAKKIVEGRPFKSPDDLVSRKIISKTLFGKIKGRIHVVP